jgi:hydrogenase maturation protease
MRTQKTLILCVGSRLMRDDALGLVVGETLLKRNLPAKVKIFETGSDVFTLLDEIAGFDNLIIVDAIKSGSSPGEVVVVDLGRLSQERVSEIQSLHDVDVISAIRLGYELFREKMPRKILLVGVGAKEISLGIGLSEEVEKAIPKILETISHLLELDSPDD